MFFLMSHENEIEILYSYNRLFIGIKANDNILVYDPATKRMGYFPCICIHYDCDVISSRTLKSQQYAEDDQGVISILRRIECRFALVIDVFGFDFGHCVAIFHFRFLFELNMQNVV